MRRMDRMRHVCTHLGLALDARVLLGQAVGGAACARVVIVPVWSGERTRTGDGVRGSWAGEGMVSALGRRGRASPVAGGMKTGLDGMGSTSQRLTGLALLAALLVQAARLAAVLARHACRSSAWRQSGVVHPIWL